MQRARLEAAFQFHKGAIRTLNYASARAAYANFNSIKVRLELIILMMISCMLAISIP